MVIRNIRSGTMSKKRQSQTVHRQMSFDPIGSFVKTKTFYLILALQVFLTAWESMIIKVVHSGFFLLAYGLAGVMSS